MPQGKPLLGHSKGFLQHPLRNADLRVKDNYSFWKRTHHVLALEWTFNLLQMDHNRALMPSLTWACCHAASSFQRCTEMALLLLVSSLFGDSPGRLSLLCDSFWLASSGLSSSFWNFPRSWHCSSLIQLCPNHAKKPRNPGPSSSVEFGLQMVSIHTLLHLFPAPQMPSQ